MVRYGVEALTTHAWRMMVAVMACLASFAAVPATAKAASIEGSAPSASFALVIGNSNYAGNPTFQSLANPQRDADLVGAALTRIGFKVTRLTNASRAQMLAGIDALVSEAARSPNATLLVYYAGHGLGAGDQNFLVPPDLAQSGPESLDTLAVSTRSIAATLRKSAAAHIFLFIDACRTDPATATRGVRAIRPAWVAENPIPDVKLLYSTSPNQTATDGAQGQHSPFAEAVATEIGQPGQDYASFLQAVSRRVADATDQVQLVWMSGAVEARPIFCFAGCGTNTAEGTALSSPNLTALRELNDGLAFYRFSKSILTSIPPVESVLSRCAANESYCIFTQPYIVRNSFERHFDQFGVRRTELKDWSGGTSKGAYPAELLLMLHDVLWSAADDSQVGRWYGQCQEAYPLMTARQCQGFIDRRVSALGIDNALRFVPKQLVAGAQRPLVFDPLLDADHNRRRDVTWQGGIDRGKRDGCGYERIADGRLVMGCFTADSPDGIIRVVDPGRGWWVAKFSDGKRLESAVDPGPFVSVLRAGQGSPAAVEK